MILFCGIPSETPLRLAIEEAESAGVPHVVFNQRQSRGVRLTLGVGEDGTSVTGSLELAGQTFDLSQFTGVYGRMLHPRQLPEHRTESSVRADATGARRAEAAYDLLLQWMQLAPCRVANRPRAMLSNASKPFQAQRIAEVGFGVPPTIVTNAPEVAAEFRANYGRVIFKSVSGIRSIVGELTPALLPRLSRVRTLTTQFQAHIPGHDIRVHVVGEAIFATKIVGQSIDYRYAARDGLDVELTPTEVPDDVAQRCVRLARALDLPFCGIDLRVTPDGDYYCFEANPSPAYSYYEEAAGQPIARALVQWLRGPQN
jgi:glutathione synthase/RimK-type ligase-like ATP-grasp enzyme